MDVPTVITRPSSTALLAISSIDRYSSWSQRRSNPTNPFSFTIQKNQAIMNGYFRRIAMTEFRMNWTLPNISSAWANNTVNFNYIYSSTTYSFVLTIPTGFYGAEELATALTLLIENGTSSVSGIPGFEVSIEPNQEADIMTFTAPTGYTFWFTPTSASNRQLFDMLALPNLGTPGTIAMTTGIPDLRATSYIDLVCSQLTNNMRQKDSTSAPVVRDMMARIYLDDSVPSQAVVTTNYYNVTYASTTSTTYSGIDDDMARFTVASTSGFTEGAFVTISGISGGVGWNGTEIASISSISGYTLELYFPLGISGTPTGTATLTQTIKGATTQSSTPQTTWDDRVNGVTPFVLYRQFPVPKQIRWEHTAAIGNLQFEMYDDQGRSLQTLWNQYGSGSLLTNITAKSATSGLQVTYTVASSGGFVVGQQAQVDGIYSATGYNAVVTIFSIPSSTSIVVVYPTGTTFTGTPNFTDAQLSSFTDYTSSFAWNMSILCSED